MSRPLDDLTPLRTLFQIGVLGGLADGRLLEIFTTEGDAAARETAFGALVERHGPVVLKVCRDVLRNEHAAEDAFQATFLVLARRARSIRKAHSVASWLFGVARRVALKARADEARRRATELRGVKMGIKGGDVQIEAECWPELYEELDRLPERYREPLVLCYLAGLTYEQAAGGAQMPGSDGADPTDPREGTAARPAEAAGSWPAGRAARSGGRGGIGPSIRTDSPGRNHSAFRGVIRGGSSFGNGLGVGGIPGRRSSQNHVAQQDQARHGGDHTGCRCHIGGVPREWNTASAGCSEARRAGERRVRRLAMTSLYFRGGGRRRWPLPTART